jgi:PQQ-dependent dehydrogenase (methanol/ethanol family)
MLLLVTLAACGTSDAIDRVDDARLNAADRDSANWLTYGRTYNEQRFSPLRQVNDSTVRELGLVWSQELPTTRGVEATPIVVDGVIYTTSAWSIVYAFDAITGRQLWTYDPKVDRSRARTICCDVVNRGLALYRGKLFLATLDGRLVAIAARTGLPVWDVTTVDKSKPYAITGAPRIAKGRVLIGNAGAEFGVRGYVSAFDAETGKLAWRVFSVPGDPKQGFESKALEDAAKTWHGEYWKTGGGGTTWDPIVYDPDLDLVYFGTGNGTAWYRDLRSPGGGDNLFLASILAVRGQTGEYVWHYQVTPGDNWDYDATQAADARRSHDQRNAAKGRDAGVEERILLRARSDDGSIHLGDPVRQRHLVGHARGFRERASGGITDGLRRTETGARLAGCRRCAQLAADGVRCLEGRRLPRCAERNATRPRAERRVGLGLERPKHG